MTFLCALLGIAMVATNVPGFFADLIRLFFRGTTPTRVWVEELTDAALTVNPGASYEALPGVKAVLFDNLYLVKSTTSYLKT